MAKVLENWQNVFRATHIALGKSRPTGAIKQVRKLTVLCALSPQLDWLRDRLLENKMQSFLRW